MGTYSIHHIHLREGCGGINGYHPQKGWIAHMCVLAWRCKDGRTYGGWRHDISAQTQVLKLRGLRAAKAIFGEEA